MNLRRRVLLVSVLFWTLVPLLALLLWSFSAGWRWPMLLPQAWSSRAWEALAQPGTRALPALLTSLGIALLATLLALGCGVPAALALGRYRIRWRTLIELLIFAPLLVPPLTVAIGLQVVFIRLGLADTLLGVVLVHSLFSLPYVVLLLTNAVARLGVEWEQQARSLGATPWRAFWHVTLPLLWPTLSVAALLAFLVSWSQYALTLLIGGGQIFTLPLLVFAAARGSDPALGAAAALLFIAPTTLFLVVAARNLRETTGGVGIHG